MRAALIFLFLIILQNPIFSVEAKKITDGEKLPNIFIYKIPDSTPEKETTDATENDYINTSVQEDDTVTLQPDDDVEDDAVLGATTLKGYAQYVEDSDSIYLKDDKDKFVLNIKVPQKISSTQGLDFSSSTNTATKKKTKGPNADFDVKPQYIRQTGQTGNFTLGALYNNEIDGNAMLESETGLFSKYEKNKFALNSSYKKSLNTLYNEYYDTFTFGPELKLNSYMSVKNNYSADITRNRKSAELVLSVNPFGKKDKDRMYFELGAKQTLYPDGEFVRNQFSFTSTFKL